MKTFLKTDEVEKEIYAIVGKYIPDNSTFEKPEKFKEFSIIQVFYSILTIEQDRNAHSDYLEQLSLCAKTALGENKGQKFIDYVSKSVESIDLENLLELHVKLCEIPQPYLESFLVSKFGETDSLGRVVLDLVSYFTKDKDNVKKADFDCANSSFLQNCVRQDDKLTGYASDRDDSFVKMLMKQHVSRKNIDIKDQIYEMDKIVDSYDIVFLKKETDSIQNFMVSDGYPEDIVCSESSLILSMKVLKALSDTGKGFLILPKATAFNDRAYSARKYLIQNHYIEAVIDVNPSLSFTKTQYVIYVLSKNNKQIRMIDAYRENNSLSSEEIVSLFETDSSENSLILSYEDINNDYSLLVTSYLNRANYNCGKETLCNVAEVKRGSVYPIEKNSEKKSVVIIYPKGTPTVSYISMSCVDDIMISEDHLKKVRYEKSFEKYCIGKGYSIVISRAGPNFKISLINVEKEDKVLVGTNLFVITPSNEIDPFYLVSFLRSKKGQKMLLGVTTGTSMPMLNLESLKSIEIPIAGSEEMSKLGSEFRELIVKFIKQKKELQNTEDQFKKKTDIFSDI